MVALSFDIDADALYVQISTEPVARTADLDQGSLVDLDAEGRVVGLEIIAPARRWPIEDFLQRFEVPLDAVATLRSIYQLAPGRDTHPQPITGGGQVISLLERRASRSVTSSAGSTTKILARNA